MTAICKDCGERFEIDDDCSHDSRPKHCEDCEDTYMQEPDPDFYAYMEHSDADPGL